MTAETAVECIRTNLELLREATRTETAFHLSLDTGGGTIVEVQAARGVLVNGNPEQLRGQSLDALPWLKSRLASLRVSELRDTGHPRPDQAEDAAVWANLGLGSVLIIGYFIEGRPAGLLGIGGELPRDNWEVQLHLLMKLVGSSLATGLERIEIKAHLADLQERNDLALHSANDGLWDFDTLNNRVYLSPRWKAMLGYDEVDVGEAPDWRTLVHSDDMSRVQAAIRDHVAGKTPLFESLHRMRHATGEWRWVISRAKAKVDQQGPAAAAGRRRARHHRTQALRGGAVPREGERADHPAEHRRRRHHDRRERGHRLRQSGRRDAHRLAPGGQPGAGDRGDLPRLPRGNLRAAGESAGGRHPPHPLDQIGAPDAAHPARRQRNLRREHGLADPRRQRRGFWRRARIPRRERGARAQPPALLPREPRRAHGARQPARVREPHGAGAEERQGA